MTEMQRMIEEAVRIAVAEEAEACAAICDRIQREADARHAASYDPGEGADGASEAAEAIRARHGLPSPPPTR